MVYELEGTKGGYRRLGKCLAKHFVDGKVPSIDGQLVGKLKRKADTKAECALSSVKGRQLGEKTVIIATATPHSEATSVKGYTWHHNEWNICKVIKNRSCGL